MDIYWGRRVLDKTEIGRRIKKVREGLGLTQQVFSEKLEIGRVTLARYETGERTPDAEFLLAINNILGIEIVWLLTGLDSGIKKSASLSKNEESFLSHYRLADECGKRILEAAAIEAAKPMKNKKAV